MQQGASEYTDCHGLIEQSSSQWPNTAVLQISQLVTPHKAVIGKIATPADGNNGYMDPNTLAGCVAEAKNRGWDAGVMVWQVGQK